MTLTKDRETIFKFSSLENAKNFTEHSTKLAMIILGDDEKFWVATPAHASRLVKQGYELAE